MTKPTTIVFHLGAPKPNMDALTSSLRKDNQLLSDHRMMARRPSLYRKAVHDRLMEIEIDGNSVDDTTRFLAKMCQKQSLDRLLISDSELLGPIEKTFSKDAFYSQVEQNIKQLINLFPENPCEFFLEVRNPLTFVPEVSKMLGKASIDETLNGTDIANVRWRGVVENIRISAPNSPITIWRHEDIALAWPSVLRSVSGVEKTVRMQGDLDQASHALPENAVARLKAFLEERPELSFPQCRHVIASFLEAAQTEEEKPNPPMELIEHAEQVSQNYQEDLRDIRSMRDVSVLD